MSDSCSLQFSIQFCTQQLGVHPIRVRFCTEAIHVELRLVQGLPRFLLGVRRRHAPQDCQHTQSGATRVSSRCFLVVGRSNLSSHPALRQVCTSGGGQQWTSVKQCLTKPSLRPSPDRKFWIEGRQVGEEMSSPSYRAAARLVGVWDFTAWKEFPSDWSKF